MPFWYPSVKTATLLDLPRERCREKSGKVEPLACTPRSVGGVLYADDDDTVSKSAESFTMMTVIATFIKAAGLPACETKTETMLLRTANRALRTSPLAVAEAGQRYA